MDKTLLDKYDTLREDRDRYKSALKRIKKLEELRLYEREGNVYDIACEALSENK